MNNRNSFLLTFTLALFVALSATPASIQAGSPVTGKWKIVVMSGGNELSIWLLQLEQSQGKLTGKVVSVGPPVFNDTKVEKVHQSKDSIHVTMNLNDDVLYLSGQIPKGNQSPKELKGSLIISPYLGEAARWEKTDAKEIDKKKIVKENAAGKDYSKLEKIALLADRILLLKGILQKHADDPVVIQSGLSLMNYTAETAKKKELQKTVDQILKVATRYGPELEMVTLKDVAKVLLNSKNGQDLALKYAQLAQQRITPDTPVVEQLDVLKIVAAALSQEKQFDQMNKVHDKIDKLELILDEEFAKNAIPFTPNVYKGRKGTSDRVAVVELFTGAQCPPCVAADVSFDALLKTYKAKDVVLLQYHLHIPRPDPMTNKDSEERADFYEVNATPTLLINGKKGPGVGGYKQHAEDRYKDLFEKINTELEEPALAQLTMKATRLGDTIDIEAEVTKLPANGKKLRLRFVLIEELVRYAGSNKQRLHHHVVRDFPGGVEGTEVKKAGTFKQSFDLKKVKLGLIDYLEDFQKNSPQPLTGPRPLELKHLKIVALIQDAESKEILNAVQVNVPEK